LAAEFGISRMTAGFFADFVLNGIFNAGIAIAQYRWGDDQMAALALFFVMLPVIHRISPINKFLVKTSENLLTEVSNSLAKKILLVNPKSAQEWTQFVSKLTKDEINLLSDVSKMEKAEIKNLTDLVTKKATEKMAANQVKSTVSFFSRLIPGWKGVLRGVNGLVAFGIDMAMIEQFSKSWENLFGTMPRPGDYEALLLLAENLPNEKVDEFFEIIKSGDLTQEMEFEGEVTRGSSILESIRSFGDVVTLIDRPSSPQKKTEKEEEEPQTDTISESGPYNYDEKVALESRGYTCRFDIDEEVYFCKKENQ
jgi:hypothetical protein